jgi:hypothetical protein
MAAPPAGPKALRGHLADRYTYEELAAVAAHFDVQFSDIGSAPRAAVADEIVRAVVRQRRLPELAEYVAARPGSGRPEPVAARASSGLAVGAILFVLAALTILACVLWQVVIPAVQAINQGGRLGEVLYAEPFERPTPPWTEDTSGPVRTAFTQGAFQVTLAAEDEPLRWRGAAGPRAGDFTMLATVTLGAAEGVGRYGLFFRADDRQEYRFLLDTAGRYTLQLATDGEFMTLIPWQRDGAIRTGTGARNSLVVRARRASIEIEANGSELARISDATLTSGTFGLAAEVDSPGQLQVQWNELVVRSLR